MNYIAYMTVNLVNDKIYVGVHACKKIDDGYLGSGIEIVRAVKKYGRENFQRHTLMQFESKEEMLQFEAELVDEEFISRDYTYNVAYGGYGGAAKTAHGRKKISEARSKSRASDELKQKLSEAHRGSIHTDEAKRKIGESNRGKVRSDEVRAAMSRDRKGRTHSEETKRRMSEKRRGVARGPYKKKSE